MTKTVNSALELAILFHDTYERLAPQFGYETRPETRTFSPSSKNGQLMRAVCEELLAALRPVSEPKVPQGWQVYVQRNVMGLGVGLGYPQSCEMIPYGGIFDTRDAAALSVQQKGWDPMWWSVRSVPNRG